MPESLRRVPDDAVLLGWDFSTGGVKCLAFNVTGDVLESVKFPNDLWTADGVSELNLFQLEGQARATVRAMAYRFHDSEKETRNWLAGGISATHHTASRIDSHFLPIRRAICWNDQTLAKYHAEGLKRLGGPERVRELIGGPWAERYSLSHLVKDETTLPKEVWERTHLILSHGALAAGYLSGHFGTTSVSSAASTGLMDLRTDEWRAEMLGALANPALRELAWQKLPMISAGDEPIGSISENLALESELPEDARPLIFPTLDDQAAGLVGGGATDPGHVAIVLGNSAVVNSSAGFIPEKTNLDVMKLNWGPYLWMRCYSNGAQFLDKVVGDSPDWAVLEGEARKVPAGSDGVSVLPFLLSEPSLGVTSPRVVWTPQQPASMGVRVRAAFEAIAYLIALAVKEHEAAGQSISRISVSGGIAKSDLMLEILASTLDRPLERLASDEGPALGAAVAALWGLEKTRRNDAGILQPYRIADAVRQMVKYRDPVKPRPEWREAYQNGLTQFQTKLKS